MNGRAGLVGILVLLGATWGLTLPLAKIAVGPGGHAFGLVVWEMVIALILLAFLIVVRGKKIDFSRRHFRLFLFIAVFGNLIPTSMWFFTAAHLPAGILAIVISLVPMFSLPIALFLRLENFQWLRLMGIVFGALAVVLLVGPETSLPDPSKVVFVLLALIGPVCYGIEGNGVAKIGLGGLDAFQALFGATVVGLVFAVPLALATGQWFPLIKPWGAPEYALLVAGILTTLAYAGYIWLLGRAGSVFAAQVSYLVTGFGVFWSIILLAEAYSGWVWFSLVLMMAGLFLVQPKMSDTLEESSGSGKTDQGY